MSENKESKCAICDVKLNNLNSAPFTEFDFNRVCLTHKQSAQEFLIEITQKELGYITDLPSHFNQCGICNCKMSEGEINSLSKSDFIITCNNHREVRSWFQIDIAKAWFKYLELHPGSVYNDANTNYEFRKWYCEIYSKQVSNNE